MTNNSSVIVTSEFGLIVRRNALVERQIDLRDLFTAMEVEEGLDVNDHLLSFGPHFGSEALNTIMSRLTKLGLVYFDDFFEFCGDYPPWCSFQAGNNPSSSM
ncbi:hypothetical protein ACH79_38440 [Bradyrhizobium sp. CCBAU 051011]|uniref:hypothetical protein n=1 Tax=Bradyrhizobium sp. CCBAU 051011 TaxID=858422 RepID=UPI001373BBDB|nr:hypothetical protein [Bradyrhizobium sp. CCBAU 051011]QHO77643.1 hypothetical protein ACH79_38440 [Bradyrhizobium sp. CCBAU 051011]